MKARLILIASLSMLLVALWQIEEIWRSLQNGWLYNLPFGMATSNYWMAHDFWFVILFLSWLMMAFLPIVEDKKSKPL